MTNYKLIPHNGEAIVVDTETGETANNLNHGAATGKDGKGYTFYDGLYRMYFPVTNSLDDLLKLQREKEADRWHKSILNATEFPEFVEKHKPIFVQSFLAALDSHPFTAEDMAGFGEWLNIKHWWKSTDTRYPLTLGLYSHAINGDFKVEYGKTIEQLLDLYLTETALSRLKESGVEIEFDIIHGASDQLIVQDVIKTRPKLTDGKVTITKFI